MLNCKIDSVQKDVLSTPKRISDRKKWLRAPRKKLNFDYEEEENNWMLSPWKRIRMAANDDDGKSVIDLTNE